ncbi:MAG: S9 family peptidase [Cytophagales bacterium]|nr:S9 family peptidase [Bernardetiaceae bacterium]MDW8205571.1 S9 family peptidase [Cytophagales bacterium]
MKNIIQLLVSWLALVILASCSSKPSADMENQNLPQPPVAKVIPKTLIAHGHTRIDNYYWLNNREDTAVINYLKAENAYLDAVMQPTAALQEKLFHEMKSRIKEQDESVPYFLRGYHYITRYEQGGEYPIYTRKKGSLQAPEEIMLNVNEMAKGYAYYQVGGLTVSDDNRLLAYAVDTVSRRIYTLYFKDLQTGQTLPDVIANTTGNVAWAADSKTVFYTRQDLQTLRAFQIWKHVIGTHPQDDQLVYEEKDETFNVGVYRSKSNKYLFIASSSTLTTEVRFLDASQPNKPFTVFLPRERGHEYGIDHAGDKFYIRTNWQAENFRIMEADEKTCNNKQAWKEIIPHRADVFVESFDVFKNHMVVEERKEGLIRLRIRPWSNPSAEHYIDFGEPAYTAGLSSNPEFDTQILRYTYTSLTTPNSVYDYDMVNKTKKLLKQQEVLGGFNREDYQTERLYATARDGVKVPISLVYKKGFQKNGKAPLLLYAYGSYGFSTDVYFSSNRLSLLNRGFAFAIAHVRGGQEMGRQWYENGKLLKKKNTFYDFIDCAKYLIAAQYTSPEHLYANGGSAGGLLMGAVANMAPELFKGIIADVPFVDVVTTMLDESIPLTTGEYDEWGNPNDKTYYDYMLSYSPYDNVERKAYPNMLVLTGLHDSQVQYWEPAKWVAKLRAMKTDNNLLLLRTNMEAGHSGASGRFAPLKEVALEYAFLLHLEGIRE